MDTARELIVKTFRREPCDRVPVCPIIFENYVRKYYADPAIDVPEATVGIYKELGADIVHRNCFPFLYLFVETPGPTNDHWQVRINRKETGKEILWETGIRTPKKTLRVSCRGNQASAYETLCAYKELPIKEKGDLDLVCEYEPRWEKENVDLEPVRKAKALVGDKGILCPWVQGVFNFAALYYRVYDQLLTDPYLDEGFYRSLMEHCLEQNWSYLKILLENGVDALAYGGNMAGGQVGPQFFSRFVLEYERKLILRIHDAGGLVLWHNCGKASSLFPVYREVGMDCFESLAQSPEGDADLEEAKQVLGPVMSLSGGIDQKNFLVAATPQEIETKVREVLEILKPGGGYFLSTVDYLSEETPLENIRAFVDAGRKYGNTDS